MELLRFPQKYEAPLVIALGFFDCIHLGHGELISRAVKQAKTAEAQCAVFTFSDDINVLLNRPRQIYGLAERKEAIEALGADCMICARFDSEFLSMDKKEFLDRLFEAYDVKGIVCGADYSFGKGAQGNAEYLLEYARDKGSECTIVPFLTRAGEKISTTSLKTLVASGSVEELNELLTMPYFRLGEIVHAHRRGTRMGFPTANLSVDTDTTMLSGGIYATAMLVDGKTVYGMTNVGPKPTFADDGYSIETYLFDFNGDIYGKNVKLSFYKRMRDIVKFDGASALAHQLASDEKSIRTYFAENSRGAAQSRCAKESNNQ